MKTTLSGWGRFPIGRTELLPVEQALLHAGQGIPRGAGRSYGDASFRSTGYTFSTEGLRHFLHFDPRTGVLITEAGVTLYEIIQTFLPRGWFPAVVPGTQFVTIGGAIASNIHGKNHHVEGSFCDHVEWVELLLSNGEVRRLTPSEPLFWATAGGMGLTGVILRAAIRMQPIPTGFVWNITYKTANLEKALEILMAEDEKYPFAVAWVDHAHGRGRSVVHLGRWAGAPELPPGHKPHQAHPAERLSVPFTPPLRLINWLSVETIATFYWLTNPAGAHLVPYHKYFFPLDGVRHWNRAWGPDGFIQFQFVVPEVEDLIDLWQRLRKAPGRSFLTVVKRMGKQQGPLAFTGPGWTLAIDLPNTEAMRRFLLPLYDRVAEKNGRIYLTKDSLLSPETFKAMYPAWKDFLQQKAVVDPEGRWASDLSRRIGLTA